MEVLLETQQSECRACTDLTSAEQRSSTDRRHAISWPSLASALRKARTAPLSEIVGTRASSRAGLNKCKSWSSFGITCIKLLVLSVFT